MQIHPDTSIDATSLVQMQNELGQDQWKPDLRVQSLPASSGAGLDRQAMHAYAPSEPVPQLHSLEPSALNAYMVSCNLHRPEQTLASRRNIMSWEGAAYLAMQGTATANWWSRSMGLKFEGGVILPSL